MPNALPLAAARRPDTFPRWVLMCAGGVVAFSLISVGLVRLTHGKSRDLALPAPATAALLRAAAPLLPAPPVDLPGFRAQMAEVAATVRAIFERRVGALGTGASE
jgi:hypothetical protein